jgi:hypothetical protein
VVLLEDHLPQLTGGSEQVQGNLELQRRHTGRTNGENTRNIFMHGKDYKGFTGKESYFFLVQMRLDSENKFILFLPRPPRCRCRYRSPPAGPSVCPSARLSLAFRACGSGEGEAGETRTKSKNAKSDREKDYNILK